MGVSWSKWPFSAFATCKYHKKTDWYRSSIATCYYWCSQFQYSHLLRTLCHLRCSKNAPIAVTASHRCLFVSNSVWFCPRSLKTTLKYPFGQTQLPGRRSRLSTSYLPLEVGRDFLKETLYLLLPGVNIYVSLLGASVKWFECLATASLPNAQSKLVRTASARSRDRGKHAHHHHITNLLLFYYYSSC